MWPNTIRRASFTTINFYKKLSRSASNIAKVRTPLECSDIQSIKKGEKYHGFLTKRVESIPEFKITAVLLEHDKTKAQIMHLYRDDTNNVFSINFRTTPQNSTGLPHILEHTVLCGSELYPVRDPFFKMLNRSLATFMNALTGSDYTLYPFSTQNYSDYTNLQKVYLDAVFRPQLKELDFMQEGWRLENIDPNDIKTDIVIKGVVYNEMKGVFAENDNILGQKLQNLILPNHTYGVVSGGDPKEIPDLTWNDLKNFHKQHYHPSNCRIYSYGNFPLLPSLEYIDKEYLSKYAFSPPTHTIVPNQTRWESPKREHIKCRFDSLGESIDKQNAISISLLCCDITDAYETFVVQFLTELLIKGPNSPFYKSFIEPNISGGFTSSTGFDNQPRDSIFTVGLQGVKKEDFDKIISIFDTTIDDCIDKGFEQQHIDSVLHRYEISLKHENNNFGLGMLFAVTSAWNHTEDVLGHFEANKLIEKLKNDIKNKPKYLQDVVKKYFKDNKHKLILTMSADKDYDKLLIKEEKNIIKNKIKNLTDKDKREIYEKGLELQKQQKELSRIELLPTLTIDDISSDIEKIDKVKVTLNNVSTQINRVNSNGIVYFKAILNTNDLSPEQQMLLPLFCYTIHKLGTEKLNFREFDNLVNRKTAGLNFNAHVGESLFHLHTYEPGLVISSYALEKNVESMWDIWNQIFNIGTLKDVQRFRMLVQLYVANLTNGIADAGHVYAMQSASGLVSGSAYQVELLSGLHHVSYMKRLMHTSNFKAMLDEILNMAKILFDKKKMRVALNLSPENQSNILHTYENFINKLPEAACQQIQSDSTYVTGKVWSPTEAVNCQHHVLNVPVNYCSKAVLTVPYTHQDFAKLRILSRLLSSKYLHPELREKQGAYGGGARLLQDGVFSFYSYRDPQSLATLDVFDNAYDWFRSQIDKITGQDIFEAKLGIFQSVDAPVPPCNKGCDEFLKGITPDIKQRHRAELMSVDKTGLEEVAEKYLGPENVLRTGKVVIGSKNDKMNVSKRQDEMWTIVENIV
ncbi:presequence protease, mitochondrial [Diorhabda sublineata]|uniref:presequence protease, mitochondrial n=1 Tax=Diorhabda sublineata TaxID=1163346 RepID=UPI0024E14036|nr:presequence protease, mitochondrial [Diorhabda sublineata]XP_056641244.1 presequence protease, mitochondrial [Diorhabda sublineata]